MTAVSERLDAIEARKNAATPGPWKVRECPPCTERGRLEVNIWDESGNLMVTDWCDDDEFHRPDAEFIANAPSDVAYLLDLARKQQSELDAVRAVHEFVEAVMYSGSHQRLVKVCTGCGTDDGNWQRWPCPTIKALEGK